MKTAFPLCAAINLDARFKQVSWGNSYVSLRKIGVDEIDRFFSLSRFCIFCIDEVKEKS